MNYYKKNSDIAHEFNVSKTTVSRWIEGALEKKNNLQLYRSDEKVYVLKSENNKTELLKLKEGGNKFKSAQISKSTEPNKHFYETFSSSQISSIISNLEVEKEIYHKYTYVDGGSEIWSEYYYSSRSAGTYPTIERVQNLINRIYPYLKSVIDSYTTVNVIDIGPGNSEPVKELIRRLIDEKRMGKYIAVDISKEIMDISKKNILSWFPNIEFESLHADIERTYFGDHFYQYITEKNSINLVLYLGTTIGNSKFGNQTLKNIRDGLSKEDLLVFSNTADRKMFRTAFSYATSELAKLQNTWIPKSLGIDVEDCEYYARYDEDQKAKILCLKLDKDYEIIFHSTTNKRKISLAKGEEIIIWRHHMTDLNKVVADLTALGLQMTATLTEPDLAHVIITCQAN